MKRTILGSATVLLVFAAVFAVLVLRPVPKVKAHHGGCSNATLKGDYGLTALGSYVADFPAVYPGSISGILTFDGKGGLSGSNLFAAAPPLTYGVTAGPYSFSGQTYTVNSDCSLSVTLTADFFSGALDLNGTVVDNGGNEVIGNLFSKHSTATFQAKKVAREEREPEPF